VIDSLGAPILDGENFHRREPYFYRVRVGASQIFGTPAAGGPWGVYPPREASSSAGQFPPWCTQITENLGHPQFAVENISTGWQKWKDLGLRPNVGYTGFNLGRVMAKRVRPEF
jgi:hypothetical protein